ncbi:MAG: CaiB/BaiF CoA transferase family protein [Rubricella sp.]
MGRGGALSGVRVIEFAGLGPGPFCGMMLADLGADVVRIDRPGADPDALGHRVMGRGKRSILLDLKAEEGRARAFALVSRADLLIEGFRPGVMERLGLGPEQALAANPALVYGRMTGWGQDGPRAREAGHDIDYIALTGALHAIGGADGPVPPLNLLGDFGGGALYLAVGLLAGLHHARVTGEGQVVDAAIVDGTVHLTAMIRDLRGAGQWRDGRGANLLDGGAHFYRCYACGDGRWIAVGAIEPQFYAAFRAGLGLDDPIFDRQNDRALWPELSARVAAVIARHPRAHWLEVFAGTDACVAPVNDWDEAARDPHMAARGVFVDGPLGPEPAPAPRMSRTPGSVGRASPAPGADTIQVLRDWLAEEGERAR